MMYRVLLVDDETTNYQLFEKLVPWEQKGFEIAGTAADGLEALQKYDELQPDLIFMDIQLPMMDGLECIRHIREENEKVRIVIVSAYGDFSYAQKAIQYGVQDFLLKPVSRLMLNQLVDKMKASLDSEGTSADKKETDRQCIPYLEKLLHGEIDETEGNELLQDKMLCGLMVTDAQGHTITDARRGILLENFEKANRMSVDPVLEYCPSPGHSVIIWDAHAPYRQTSHTSHAQGKEAAGENVFQNAFPQMLRDGLRASGYISSIYLYDEQTMTLGNWLKQFAGIQNYGFYGRESGIYRLEEDPFSEMEFHPGHLEQKTAEAAAQGSCEQLLDVFDGIFQMAAEEKVNPQVLKETILDSLVRIKFMLKKFDSRDSFLMLRNVRIDTISQIQNADQLRMFVEQKLRGTFDEIGASCRTPGKNLVFRANAFTEISYQDPNFSVQAVADEIGISKNYFTSQYKEASGIGFWEYVTKLHLEKAKELLVTTEEMVGTIARTVGYESEFHFSRKFKEYTGQSPQNYRRQVENSKNNTI